jgi:hypothetical protein
MKRVLCVALLCAAGCASVPTSAPATVPVDAPSAAVMQDGGKERGWQVWIPHFFADLWEIFDARIGMDYGFGAHIKVTDLARLGIFDYSDFSLIGVESDIFKGGYHFPNMDPTTKNGSWDLAIKLGVGLGAEASLHTWEIIDCLCTLVTAGYWSPNMD